MRLLESSPSLAAPCPTSRFILYWTQVGNCFLWSSLIKFQGGRPSGYRAWSSLWRLRLLQDWGKTILNQRVEQALHLIRIQVYNLCPDMQFCATPPVHGNLARYSRYTVFGYHMISLSGTMCMLPTSATSCLTMSAWRKVPLWSPLLLGCMHAGGNRMHYIYGAVAIQALHMILQTSWGVPWQEGADLWCWAHRPGQSSHCPCHGGQ